MADARSYTMACRVDLTMLLPDRLSSSAGIGVDYTFQDVQLDPPGLIQPKRSRYTPKGPSTERVVETRSYVKKDGYGRVVESSQITRTITEPGTPARKKDALLLGSGADLLDEDLQIKASTLATDPSGLVRFDTKAYVPGLIGASMDWERNPLSEPDKCDLVVRADELPVDLRVLRGAQVDAWIYCHGDKDKCDRGQPGYFGGLVTNISKDRNANTVSLSCVDYTHVLIQAKVTKAMLAVTLDQTLARVVAGMLEEVPGADRWRVFQSDEIEDSKARKALGLKPRKKTKTTSKLRGGATRVGGTFEMDLKANGKGDFVGRKGGKFGLDFYAEKKVRTVINMPTVGHLLGTTDLTVWGAILKMAALVGLVPNFGIDDKGRPTIAIITAEESQTLSLEWARIFTDGANISNLVESVDFDSGPKLDAIEVRCADPDTGKTFKGRAGRSTGGATSGRVEVQVAQGLTSDAECQARAAELWRSAWQAEFSVEVSTMAPWSIGGGPDFPDLLSAEPGEPVQVTFAGLEGAAKAAGVDFNAESLADVHRQLLESRGVPTDAAERLSEAMQTASPSTLFGIRTVTHSFDGAGDGSYECQLVLDAYLGHPEDQMEIFREPAIPVAP